jgi:DNA-binding FadR family transcriptional regulator
LAKITGNLLFISVLKTIYENINTYYESYLPKNEEILQQNIKDLNDIVRAIEMRDPKKAGELAREHVRRFNAYMEQ